VQDVYAAKGSKTFWHYKIICYKKWGNSNLSRHMTALLAYLWLGVLNSYHILKKYYFYYTKSGKLYTNKISMALKFGIFPFSVKFLIRWVS